MNGTQIPFLAEGILMLTAGTLGIFLGRAGKPYGKVKLTFHLFFVVWFAVGFGFIIYGLSTMGGATKGIWAPVGVMGLAIATQLVSGILMLASKKPPKPLQVTHAVSASLMVLSDICAFIMAGIR